MMSPPAESLSELVIHALDRRCSECSQDPFSSHVEVECRGPPGVDNSAFVFGLWELVCLGQEG